MGFEAKNMSGQSVFRQDLNEGDFDDHAFKTEAFAFPSPFGTLKGTTWRFDGIRMIHSEVSLHQPVELDWQGDTELVTMHFNLQGNISLSDEQMPGAFELSSNQHNMFYGKEAKGKMRFAGSAMRSFLVQFSRDAFFTIARDGNDAIKRFAERVSLGSAAAFSVTNLEIDVRLHNCIQSLLHCRYAESLKRMFFFSKTIEMLVLQAEAFDKAYNGRVPFIKNDYDKERILFARDCLLKNIDSPPTLSQLARMAGLNEFKLKKGFKETFNQTVFEYLSDVRLETARNDLLNTGKSVTEIACELGYSSLQHFSAAFSKKFGVSPKKMK
jgi:AraC-like DNA-binding protein